MAKAGFNCMRAAQEFLKERNIADIQGWIVSGASKRGWTTYNMAATKCETCPAKIIAIAPLIPIIPSFR
jgi:PhoPQ-activated pathogenicity-related protein